MAIRFGVVKNNKVCEKILSIIPSNAWKVLTVRLGKNQDSLWFKLHCFVQPLLVDTPRKVVVLVGGGAKSWIRFISVVIFLFGNVLQD